jgi:hypothetical protein
MSATFVFYKYTGKDGTFGTLASSIGLKRADTAIPAVYGNGPVSPGYGISAVPGDDASDVEMYPVMAPRVEGARNYSFESIFKMVLTGAPSNQVSNVRIYPRETSSSKVNFYIGCRNRYSIPTNTKSMFALYNLNDYSKTQPFFVTVGGQGGNYVVPPVLIEDLHVDLKDIGTGNLIYLNGCRQPSIKFAVKADVNVRTYNFINPTSAILSIYNAANGQIIPSGTTGFVDHIVDGSQVISVTTSPAMLTAYPSGFYYGTNQGYVIGGTISWLNLDVPVTQTIESDVVVDTQNGYTSYFINGERQPTINFDINYKYVFHNRSGSTHPLRFISQHATFANEWNIVLSGVDVVNGATDSETIYVDPVKLLDSPKPVISYQSTHAENLGGLVTNNTFNYVGRYNINTVGAGPVPTAAGETDFIYLQMEALYGVGADDYMPELVIEYDEN